MRTTTTALMSTLAALSLAACAAPTASGTLRTDSATPTVPPTPESTAAISHATTKDIYCKALVDLKAPLTGLQNSTMTTDEAVMALGAVQTGFQTAQSSAQILTPGDTVFQTQMALLATTVGHLKVNISSGADITTDSSDLGAAVAAAPVC